MKVLLLKNVEDLGLGGDVCEVSNGYARNYLFPRKLALKATKNALLMSDKLHKKALEEQKKINSEAEFLADKLSAHICEVIASTDDDGHLYGSVSERTISSELIDAGFEVDSGHVLLHEHIKQIGEYKVPIKVYGDIRAEITVIVKSDNKDVLFVKPKTEPTEETPVVEVADKDSVTEKAVQEGVPAEEEPAQPIDETFETGTKTATVTESSKADGVRSDDPLAYAEEQSRTETAGEPESEATDGE